MYGLILKFRREAAAVRPLLGQEDEDRCAAVLSAMEEFLAHRPKRDGTTIVHVHED
jgi:flagellar biosynthesis/type III secretory pathway protein FliH